MAHLQTDGAQVFALWHNEGMATYPKRPRDPAQLAKLMIDIASGDVDDSPKIIEPGKEYAQKGGLKGGPARAAKLGPKRRAEIAQKAAKARWANPRRKNKTILTAGHENIRLKGCINELILKSVFLATFAWRGRSRRA
jgi:hypothetical protein